MNGIWEFHGLTTTRNGNVKAKLRFRPNNILIPLLCGIHTSRHLFKAHSKLFEYATTQYAARVQLWRNEDPGVTCK